MLVPETIRPSASVSVVTNFLLTRVCIMLSRKERYESVTAFERAIFTKLMPAYIINTMLTPLVVGFLHAVRTRELALEKQRRFVAAENAREAALMAEEAAGFVKVGQSRRKRTYYHAPRGRSFGFLCHHTSRH